MILTEATRQHKVCGGGGGLPEMYVNDWYDGDNHYNSAWIGIIAIHFNLSLSITLSVKS